MWQAFTISTFILQGLFNYALMETEPIAKIQNSDFKMFYFTYFFSSLFLTIICCIHSHGINNVEWIKLKFGRGFILNMSLCKFKCFNFFPIFVDPNLLIVENFKPYLPPTLPIISTPAFFILNQRFPNPKMQSFLHWGLD